MTTALFHIEPLLPLLRSGAVVLTPNKRLRGQLLKAYGEHHRGAAVASPPVFTLTEWLNLQWTRWLAADPGKAGDSAAAGALISDPQRRHCWQQVIRESASHLSLSTQTLSVQKLAQLADDAYRNLLLWQIPLASLDNGFGFSAKAGDVANETRQFAQWVGRFEQRLRELRLLTLEQAMQIFLRAFEQGQLPALSHIHLQSFEDVPPLALAVLDKACLLLTRNQQELAAAGFETDSGADQIRVRRTAAKDPRQEITSAARWCRTLLRNQPHARIGVIVPELGKCRDLVERLFTEVFDAHYFLPQTRRYTLPFNISTGIPLGQTPLIHDAIALLKLNQRQQPLAQLCHLLYSPFFADAEQEHVLRTTLVERLRQLRQTEIRPAQLRDLAQRVAEQSGADAAYLLAKRLQQCEELRRRHQDRHGAGCSAAAWVDLFSQQLHALGWPGTRSLDSVEYQQATHWQQLLETFVSLHYVQPLFSLDDALDAVIALAAGTHFQAELKQSPIHILGTLEGAGLRFSHCWILGMDNQRWPQRPRPNPLLPIQLQQRLQLPRASIEREINFAQALTNEYLRSANDVVFSYTEQDGDNIYTCSALLQHLPHFSLQEIAPTENIGTESGLARYYQALQQSQRLQTVDCEYGPAFTAEHSQEPFIQGQETTERPAIVKGGSARLQQQAACPFNAFAKFRLGAVETEQAGLGLSALDRGNIMHGAMASIWRQLGNQRALLQLTDENLRQLIAGAVEQNLPLSLQVHREQLGEKYYTLEKTRLQRLIDAWLQMEKQRPPFDVIGVEEEFIGEFDGQYYRLRIDRIDRLASGELLLIDYKSGSYTANSWLGERPSQPQLPLYCLSYPKPIGGIAFGELNHKTQRLIGLAQFADGSTIDGIKQLPVNDKKVPFGSFTELKQHFQLRLQQLSDEHRRGYCAVTFNHGIDPRRIDGALLPLNRFDEQDFILRKIVSNNQS